jgi:hypothetical protein
MEYKDFSGKKYTNRIISCGLTFADTDDISKVEHTPMLAEVSGFERSDEERNANAQAMAAAPNLIEALKEAEEQSRKRLPVKKQTWLKMRAALQLAGEEE